MNNKAVCGGVIDNTDLNAKKHIESKDLTNLNVSFFKDFGFNYRYLGFMTFDISKTGDDCYLLNFNNCASCNISKAQINKVQNVIDYYNLAAKNGIFKVTQGLPPEFQESNFNAKYDSGEEISFTINNDPDSLYTKELFDIFADIFEDNGINLLNEQSYDVIRLNLEFFDGSVTTTLDNQTDESREVSFTKWNDKIDDFIMEKYFDGNDSYFDKVTELVKSAHLDRYNIHNSMENNDKDNKFVKMIINDADDKIALYLYIVNEIPQRLMNTINKIFDFAEKY